jgi:DNA-binding NtrC family response regulator
MSRRRIHAAEFLKLLEFAPQPLYVLDDSLVIVYLNEACRGWLGAGADELLGRPCLYHSAEEKSAADALAAGLCPPPSVLEGNEVAASVAFVSEGQTLFRKARFVPLRLDDGPVLLIVAMVDSHDSAAPFVEIKPPDSDESLDLHLQLQALRRQKLLRYRAQGVVGVTPAARRAAAQAEMAAATRASVLLVGPPGSGRRHLAEAIHYRSLGSRKGDSPILAGDASTADAPWSAKTGAIPPLVPLECGLLDTELIQSTVRAAMALADPRGTLLLCDVERMTAEAQAALTLVLSSANFPWRTIAIAATPLVELSPHGVFREDLAALLSTITIELPPLSQRRDDVPLLAQALLEEQNARGGKQLAGFATDALDRLCTYHWPGNVAELAEIVAASHQRAAGAQITRADLPERLWMAVEAAARPRRKDEAIQLDEFIARIERELIRRALARSKGNKAKAARLLGLNRPRLYRRMVQLGLIEKEEEA